MSEILFSSDPIMTINNGQFRFIHAFERSNHFYTDSFFRFFGGSYRFKYYNGRNRNIQDKIEQLLSKPNSNYTGSLSNYIIYRSKKGSLIFEKCSLVPYYSQEEFNRRLTKAKERYASYKNYLVNPSREVLRNQKIIFSTVFGSELRTFFGSSEDMNIDEIKSCYIKRERLIYSNKGGLYYSSGNKIRRLSKNKIGEREFNLLNRYILQVIRSEYEEQVDYMASVRLKRLFNCLCEIYPNFEIIRQLALKQEVDRSNLRDEGFRYISSLYHMDLNLFNLIINTDFNSIPASIKKIINTSEKNVQRLDQLYNYLRAKDCGIKDKNALLKIIKNTGVSDIDANYIFTQSPKYSKLYYKLLKKYYKNTNVNVDCLMISRLENASNSYYLAFDALRMLHSAVWCRRLNKKVELKPFDYSKLKLSLKDLHEYLSQVIRADRAAFHYKIYDMSEASIYNQMVDDYLFLLPKNSDEVVRLSEIMQNCVAGYASRISLDEIIVYATNDSSVIEYITEGIGDYKEIRERLMKENKYPACIELQKRYKINPVVMTRGNSSVAFSAPEDESTKQLCVIQNYSLNNKSITEQALPHLREVTTKYFNLLDAKTESDYRRMDMVY